MSKSAEELEFSASERGLQEKKTVSAEEREAASVAVSVVAGFETRHSSPFFCSIPPPPILQFSASSLERGKTAMETPAGEQSLGGPRGKKEGAGGGAGEEEEVVAVAAARGKLAATTTAKKATTKRIAAFDLRLRCRAATSKPRELILSSMTAAAREWKERERERERERPGERSGEASKNLSPSETNSLNE